MASALDELESLLEDARYVALYGQRSGKIRTPELFAAIASFEALANRSWLAQETIELQRSLNRAVGEIAPATLIDLRTKNPFRSMDSLERSQDTRKKLLLAGFSLLLIAATGCYTVKYNRGAHVLANLKEIAAKEPLKEVGKLARRWDTASFKDGQRQTSESVQYFENLDDLRELDGKTQTAIASAFVYMINGWMPTYQESNIGAPDVTTGSSTRYSFQECTTQNILTQSGDSAGTGPKLATTSPNGAPETSPASTKNGSPGGETGAAPIAAAAAISSINGVEEDRKLIAGFSCAGNITINSSTTILLSSFIGGIEYTLSVLGLWILPALYGTLGATVFYMRAVLNPMLPDPSLSQMVHRVALGGFAGIIFAWFWTPTSDSSTFSGVTLNAFGFAFLIGFSLDVFFAGLDRLVGFVGETITPPRVVAAGGLPATVGFGINVNQPRAHEQPKSSQEASGTPKKANEEGSGVDNAPEPSAEPEAAATTGQGKETKAE